MRASREKIANRIIQSYLMLKVPVGYALVKNCRSLIEARTGEAVDDEELENVLIRFLDLTLFYLNKEGTTPNLKEEFYNITDEVLSNREEDEDEELEDRDYGRDRF